jgi:hypothetical protein
MITFLCWLPAVGYLVWRLSVLGTGRQEILMFMARDMGIFALLAMPLSFVAQGAMVYGTVEFMAGNKVSMGDSFNRGFRSLLSVLGASFLVGLMVFAGTLACIVPGVIAALMFFVAIPVAVIESPGVSESLRRSREMTEGYKKTLFLAIIIIGMIQGAAGAIPRTLVNPALNGGDVSMLNVQIYAVVNLLISLITAALNAVVAAVVYTLLRGIRDNIDAAELSEIFR